MRVVTWNMGLADRLHRFAETHDQAWNYLAELAADLAFLQEAFPPDGVKSRGTVVRDPFRKWGSVVFSPSLPIEPIGLPEGSPLHALPNYLAFGSVSFADDVSAILTSVHARPRRAEGDVLGGQDPGKLRRSVEGPKYNDAIFAGLVPVVEGRRFLVAGDWNTARRQGTERDSRAGEEFFARVREAGWHDCVWEELGEEIQTWFGGGKLLQDDYVFCDPDLGSRVRGVRVASDAVSQHGFSDHAPLIVDIDI